MGAQTMKSDKSATTLLNGAPYTSAEASRAPNYLRERFKAIRKRQAQDTAIKIIPKPKETK